jgi:hypothetical protein
MNTLQRLCIPLLIALCPIAVAHALTLDEFAEMVGTATSATAGITSKVNIPSTGAVGGGRDLVATKVSTGVGLTRTELLGSSLGLTVGGHTGAGGVVWDGDSDTNVLKPDGLGAVDLTQDDGNGVVVKMLFFDNPSPATLRVRLYDASAPDGTKFSEVAVTINQAIDSGSGDAAFDIVIPFALFGSTDPNTVTGPNGTTFATTTTFGASGAVDVTSVGAISLTLLGNAPDLYIGAFKTNGRCTSVPNAQGEVIDECGVCLEDPNANAGKDTCGVCFNGPPGYSYEDNKITDACGLCPGASAYRYPTGTKDTCGVCISGPIGYTYQDLRDACGICGGSAKTKAECKDTTQSCTLVKPTRKIRNFEKRLVDNAGRLVKRFRDDANRSTRNKCALNLTTAEARVASAYRKIARRAEVTFRKGIKVCKGSCVTVSYAKQVRSLNRYFKVLEDESQATANLVKNCYERLNISRQPTTNNNAGSNGGAAGVVQEVRDGVNKLIRDCQKTSVCHK